MYSTVGLKLIADNLAYKYDGTKLILYGSTEVIDSLNTDQNTHTNAPSINAVQNGIRNYSVPTNSIVGFDGEPEEIPEGFEITTDQIYVDTAPIGSVVDYPSNNIPTGWLLCNGQAVSRTTYSELFAIIGITFGAGDGSTTFNIPNKEGFVTVGKKRSDTDFDTLGETGGEKEHTLTIDELPNSTLINVVGNVTVGSGSGTIKTQLNGNQPHNNMQPFTVSNFIIKAKYDAVLSPARIVDNLSSSSAYDALSANQGKILNDKIRGKGFNSVNADTFSTSGIYYLGTGCTNVPENWIKLYVNGEGGNDVSQLAIAISSENFYFRTKSTGNWLPWILLPKDIGIYNEDLNDLTYSCQGYANTSATNKPAIANGYFRVQRLSDDYILQEYIENNTAANTYRRMKSGGTWLNWKNNAITYGTAAPATLGVGEVYIQYFN